MTTDTTTPLQAKAQALYEALETRKREDGSRFVTLRDGSPEWMTEVVHAAHGDMLPDDWRYACIAAAAEYIAEADDPEDADSEFADSQVDIYNGARFAWLASNLNRMGYCDEAQEEGIASETATVVELIGAGQYMEAAEVYSMLLSALTEQVEEDDADTDTDTDTDADTDTEEDDAAL